MYKFVESFVEGFKQKPMDIITGEFLDNAPDDSIINAYIYGIGAGLKELPLTLVYTFLCYVLIFGGTGYIGKKLSK